jgi:tetratricopeptide (TPR) repeat protein
MRRKVYSFETALALLALVFLRSQVALADSATAPAGRADQTLVRSLLADAQQMVLEPGLTWYAADVAAALAEVGDVDAAEAVFGLVPLTDRFGDVRLRQLATGYARNGDFARTRQTIARIRDAEKGYADQRELAWLHAGRAFAAAKRTDAAREALREAAAAVDDGEGAYHRGVFLAEVAEAQRGNGDVAEAAATFARAVRVAAADQDVSLRHIGLKEIAIRQVKLGLLNDALDTAKRIDVRQDREHAWRMIAETLAASGRLDEARRLLEKIDRPWTAMATAVALSDAYVRSGRLPDAAEMLERAEAALQGEPAANTAMAIRLAEAHATAGNRNAAAAWLRRAAGQTEATTQPAGGPGTFAGLKQIETVPGASARQLEFRTIGVAQARLGLVEDARKSFEQARLAAQGHQPGIWQYTVVWVVAKSQAEAGLPDDAMRTMERLPEENQDWLVYVDIASSMARAGRLDEALQLVQARGGGAGGMSYVADALLKAGDLKNALRVALQGSGSHFVLRSIAQRHALAGDARPVLDALKDVTGNDKRLPLLIGLVDGLLERSREGI